MERDVTLLLLLIAAFAAWLLVHLALLVRVARAQQLSRGLRAAALLPPVAPVVGWLAGARMLASIWALLGAAYLALRAISGG
jgi:hypothetical protein